MKKRETEMQRLTRLLAGQYRRAKSLREDVAKWKRHSAQAYGLWGGAKSALAHERYEREQDLARMGEISQKQSQEIARLEAHIRLASKEIDEEEIARTWPGPVRCVRTGVFLYSPLEFVDHLKKQKTLAKAGVERVWLPTARQKVSL